MSHDHARLFFALDLDSSVKKHFNSAIESLKQSIERGDRDSRRSVKWSKPENIHLTAKFLGDTPRQQIDQLISVASDFITTQNSPAFAFVSSKIGAFPNTNRPRVIWADLTGRDFESLKRFVAKFETALSELGIQREKREFKAHLTLGRVREGANTKPITAALSDVQFDSINVTLDQLTLYESVLKSEGPTYTALKRWKLGADAARFGE